VRHFGFLGGEGLVVAGEGGERVEGEVELVAPADFESGPGEGVVSSRVALGQVGAVGGDSVGFPPIGGDGAGISIPGSGVLTKQRVTIRRHWRKRVADMNTGSNPVGVTTASDAGFHVSDPPAVRWS
jgi:hypothetical protein